MPLAHATPEAENSEATSARFVAAALDLFLEHGFNGTSLQMIGSRLGVSKAAVSYHFRSKEELLEAVVKPAFDDLRALLEEAESIKRESARRKQALTAYVDYLIRQRRVAAWLSRDVAALAHPGVIESAQDLSGRIDKMLIDNEDTPLAQVWAAAIVQALTGPILTGIDVSDDELRCQLLDIGTHLIRGYHSAAKRASSCR